MTHDARQLRAVIAKNIRELMEMHGITSHESLAERAGVGAKTVGNILNGSHSARADTLAALARALAVRPWVLLNDDHGSSSNSTSDHASGGLQVAAQPRHPLRVLFEYYGVAAVKPSDEFTIEYRAGWLSVWIKRASGSVEEFRRAIRKSASGTASGFYQLTKFDPDSIPRAERNRLIRDLYKHGRGETQASLADKFGITQTQVSRIVRLARP